MKDDDRFEDFVRTAINELDPMPAVPREELWARIDAARRFQRRAARRTAGWFAWGAGLAAMLAVGIGLGRFSMVNRPPGAEPQAALETAEPNAAPYRVVALQHLVRAEMLLTSVNSGTMDAQLQEWATDMLSTTRLLMDSPAGTDARLARLLEDLELLLVQIAHAGGSGNKTELNLIQNGIEYTDVLPRLRAALPANPAAAGT